VLWSFVMLVWLYATRLPAMAKYNITFDPNKPPSAFSAQIPERLNWPAYNYNHLMEQPTLFYAVALTLAFIGQGDGLNCTLAWAYVALRVTHSTVQAIANVVLMRFLLFVASSLVLLAMSVNAAMAVF
jgi:hypothetical protein